jgi:hypothetical protein
MLVKVLMVKAGDECCVVMVMVKAGDGCCVVMVGGGGMRCVHYYCCTCISPPSVSIFTISISPFTNAPPPPSSTPSRPSPSTKYASS